MKKSLLFLAPALIFSLVGCGGGQQGSEVTIQEFKEIGQTLKGTHPYKTAVSRSSISMYGQTFEETVNWTWDSASKQWTTNDGFQYSPDLNSQNIYVYADEYIRGSTQYGEGTIKCYKNPYSSTSTGSYQGASTTTEAKWEDYGELTYSKVTMSGGSYSTTSTTNVTYAR